MSRLMPWRHFPAWRFDDEAYLDLDPLAGLLFHRLHLICDRFGRASIPPTVGWTAARMPTRQGFEDALCELVEAGLVDVFVCADEHVRCFAIVDYDSGAPSELLRRRKRASEWRPPEFAGDCRQSPDRVRRSPDAIGQSPDAIGRSPDAIGQSPANVAQVCEITGSTSARGDARGKETPKENPEMRREKRDAIGKSPDAIGQSPANVAQVLEDKGTTHASCRKSPANVAQVPEITSEARQGVDFTTPDGSDAFAERWNDTVVSFPAGLSVATVMWLASVGSARQSVNLPWTGKSSDFLRDGLAKLVESFGSAVVDAALLEHVKVGKALGQRGKTPLVFLERLCEQQKESMAARREACEMVDPLKQESLQARAPKSADWEPPAGESRDEYVARIRREIREQLS